jgi:hypothetical protein
LLTDLAPVSFAPWGNKGGNNGFQEILFLAGRPGEPEAMVALALIPSIIVYIKRFHDRDKSGWWVLIGLIPIIGAIWLLIVLGFLNGPPGPNRSGPPVTD